MNVIRFFGRGGQGTVTAAHLLARAALYEGKYATAIARFGAERRGAPVAVYIRISDDPILVKSFPRTWDCIVVADPKIKEMIDITEGFKKGGVAVLNSKAKASEIELGVETSRIGVVDGNRIAFSVFGPSAIPITSTAMIASYSRTTGMVRLESLIKSVETEWTGHTARLNIDAMIRAHEQTEVIDAEADAG